jgi:hypothetical protein
MAAMSYPRAMMLATSRAPVVTMPSYMWPTTLGIAVPRIVEGGDLVGKGGGSAAPSASGNEGVGGLLAAKGGSCDLEAGEGVILGTNGGGGIILRTISKAPDTTVDICESPGHRPRHM